MSYVFDSSSLIYFGKLRILEKITLLEGKKIIPQQVYNEVVIRGAERKETEANYIKNLINNKHFTILSSKSSKFADIPLLSEADREVLSLAQETKSTAVIDEIYARNIAESSGIKCQGSIFILIILIKKKIIKKREAINYLDKMVKQGFYLSIEKYREVINIINKLS